MARFEEAEWKTRMRISLDLNRARAARVGEGNGVSGDTLEALAPRVSTVVRDLLDARARGELPFADLPYLKVSVDQIMELATTLRGRFTDFVVLGAGAAPLAASAVIEALAPPDATCRVRFCTEPDPDVLGALMGSLDVSGTAFCVLSPTGDDEESLAPFWIVRDRLTTELGEDGYRARVLALTRPGSSRLRQIGSNDGLTLLPLPGGVAPAWTSLTAAGLLPAAVAGVDPRELMAGAAALDQRCRAPDVWDNPAAALAACCYLMDTQLGRSVLGIWPFASRLRTFGAWLAHLWSSTLARRLDGEGQVVNAGPTPLLLTGCGARTGAGQIFAEGPADKFLAFVRVRYFGAGLRLPRIADAEYLGDRPLADLMDAACLSTAIALADEGRPSCMVELPELNAYTLGGLIMLFQISCAVTAGLYRIQAFEPSGLQAGIQLGYALLGRPGFEGLAARAASETEGEERFRF